RYARSLRMTALVSRYARDDATATTHQRLTTNDQRLTTNDYPVFTHLHVASWFSFGHGVSSPETLVRAAARRGYRALALTDINGVYGVVEFQKACEAAGIRPILGAHLVTPHQHAVVLAEDARGWGALCRAVTAIHWNPDLALSAQLAVDRE